MGGFEGKADGLGWVLLVRRGLLVRFTASGPFQRMLFLRSLQIRPIPSRTFVMS